MPPPASPELRSAYRRLYKGVLRAVQYASPARRIVRDRLRLAFRAGSGGGGGDAERRQLDLARVQRTCEFLDGAARSAGLEHRILKNLVFVWWSRSMLYRYGTPKRNTVELRKGAYAEFDRAIEKLNETMGLCIK